MENLQEKVIVITGASSGMGAATAKKLAGTGAKVVLVARRKDRLDQLVRELGSDYVAIQADVSKRAEIDLVVSKAIKQFGRIDVLWNNAAIGSHHLHIIHRRPENISLRRRVRKH